MGETFNDLPPAWQEVVNSSLAYLFGEEYPEVAEAFKAHWAKYYSEIELPEKPGTTELKALGETMCDFLAGWQASKKWMIAWLQDRDILKLNPGERYFLVRFRELADFEK